MMIGPGGDYVTRFDVKGDGLVKTRTRATAGHDADAGSSGGSAWGWLPGRKRKTEARPKRQTADRYQHTEPAALPATYAKPGLADAKSQLAMLQAIEHWLGGQQGEIDRLAADQTALEAGLSRASDPGQPAVRVIRWNGGTMKLPTAAASNNQAAEPIPNPAPAVPAPSPDHAFALDHARATDNPTPTERSAPDGQPQPDPQAVEDPYPDTRHPALARLFADDARARRSLGRLKGHGLRARRSAHQKGLPDTGCKQSTLFGAVA
jgi:hypothetical protein